MGEIEPAEVSRSSWHHLALMLGLTMVIAVVPGVVLLLQSCSATDVGERAK